ncbi:hypothetical protein FACS189454_01570 [Planctomycetales bacterium]|nr:hypothetical protein FACS189454_01570 [Planctomycetales bacterium]
MTKTDKIGGGQDRKKQKFSLFGFISRSAFLQNCVSTFVNIAPFPTIHNVAKYVAITKAFYYTLIEDVQGDYLEFGVFTGSSFCHAIQCEKKSINYNKRNKNYIPAHCWGFDSFEGFGNLSENDDHPTFQDDIFFVDYNSVAKRVKKTARKRIETALVKGLFSDSLRDGAEKMGIQRAKIIMIDCDTYIGASQALAFCEPVLQEGTLLIMDDMNAFKGSPNKGEAKAFSEFLERINFGAKLAFSYGIGGQVYIMTKK